MKKFLLFGLLLLILCFWGQTQNLSTDRFVISGEVKTEKIVTIDSLQAFTEKEIDDVVITNHLGEKKGEAKSLKGILIKDVLSTIAFNAESPKVLSEFYITFIASDGYKIVYSWNELFNSPTGDHVFILTAKEGKPAQEMNERILIISPTDYKTGRRYLKGLQKIIVGRVP